MRVRWGDLGEALTLNCPLSDPSDNNYSIEWRKDSKLILSAYGTENGHISPTMKGRIARDASLGLTLHSVEAEDEGVYECVLTKFGSGPTTPHYGIPVRLVVTAPPTVSFPEDGRIEYHEEHSTLRVECLAEGTPPPEISWTRDEQVISNNSTLFIPELSPMDRGDYFCNAANIGGQATSRLVVNFSKSTSIDFSPQNKTVIEGSNVFWHCHATAHPEKITYSWKYSDKPIKTMDVGLRTDIREGELSISSVRRSDSGWYSCEANNGHGSASTARAYLKVNHSPSILPVNRRLYTSGIGSRVQLECTSEGSPPVERISWTKNGRELASRIDPFLVIDKATEADGGVYGCQAFNAVGKSEVFEMHLVVAEPPTFSSRPPPVVYAKEGAEVEVTCSGFGDPIPIQYWLRNKQRISSSRLQIPSVSHSDHGLFVCVLSNPISVVQSEMRLFVQNSRPQPSTITNVNCLGEDGLSVGWIPGYDGDLAQSFSLHFENLDGGDGGTIVTSDDDHADIQNLTKFGRYRITIESKNEKGVTNSSGLVKNVCSSLVSPSSVSLHNEILSWKRTEGAMSYKVEYRDSESFDDKFIEMAEVVESSYRIPDSRGETRPIDIRIRSVRPFYTNSPPTSSIQFSRTDHSSEASLWWALFGGTLFLLLFLILYFCARRRTVRWEKRKKKKKKIVGEKSVCERKSEAAEGFYTPVNSLDRRDSGNWSGSRDHPLIEPYAYDEVEVENCSVVEDMLRHKYVYSVINQDDRRATILDDLRIERLKREFRQSHL